MKGQPERPSNMDQLGEDHRLVAPLTLVVTGEASSMCVFPKNRIPHFHFIFSIDFSPHETWQWKQWSWLGVPMGAPWFRNPPYSNNPTASMVLSVICAWLRNDLRVHDSLAACRVSKAGAIPGGWRNIGISPGFKHQTSGRAKQRSLWKMDKNGGFTRSNMTASKKGLGLTCFNHIQPSRMGFRKYKLLFHFPSHLHRFQQLVGLLFDTSALIFGHRISAAMRRWPKLLMVSGLLFPWA